MFIKIIDIFLNSKGIFDLEKYKTYLFISFTTLTIFVLFFIFVERVGKIMSASLFFKCSLTTVSI